MRRRKQLGSCLYGFASPVPLLPQGNGAWEWSRNGTSLMADQHKWVFEGIQHLWSTYIVPAIHTYYFLKFSKLLCLEENIIIVITQITNFPTSREVVTPDTLKSPFVWGYATPLWEAGHRYPLLLEPMCFSFLSPHLFPPAQENLLRLGGQLHSPHYFWPCAWDPPLEFKSQKDFCILFSILPCVPSEPISIRQATCLNREEKNWKI